MRRIVSIIVVVALALGCVTTATGVVTAAAGSIQGHVYETDGTTPVPSATVYAYRWSTDAELGPEFAAGTGFTDEYGSYTISGLDSGDYRVKAEANGYFSEYYNDVAGSGAATPVSVVDPNATTNIDFTLAEGGSLSGSVYDEVDATPIEGARVIAYDPDTSDFVDDGWTSENGTFTVGNNLSAGDYLVKAEADGYFSKYFDNVTESTAATLVPVTVSSNTPDIDFTLVKGGSISGLVQTDNGTAIYGARVVAYDNVTGQMEMVDEGWSKLDGSYTVGNNVGSGSYILQVEADGYFSQYYDTVADPASPDLITVTVPDEVTGKDFSLVAGGSITGFVYIEGGTTPVYGARVAAYDNATGLLIDEAWSRQDGSYIVGNNIADGYYKVGAEADDYFTEYFDNVTDLASAVAVSVTAPAATVDINFSLSQQTLIISSVAATPTGETTAIITWTTDEASTSQVEYGLTDQYGSVTLVDPTPVTSHSVNLTGLTGGTTYHFRVKSIGSMGEGRSADFTFATPDLSAPVISGVTAINITETSATITWTTNELATSQVEYGASAPGYGTSTDEDATLVTDHSVILTGLASGTTFHYKVKSRDTQGSGLWAESGDYTLTTATPADITAPAISEVAVSNITEAGATITWITDEAATSEVEYGLTDQYGSATTLDSTLVTSHSVTLTGLTAGTVYHFRVKSKDAAASEAQSADFTFTTASTPVPPVDTTPPTTPVVTDDGDYTTSLTELHATWSSTDPESDIAEYQYAIGTTAGGNDVVDWTSVTTDSGVTRTDLSLTAGTTYYFSVRARNGADLWSDVGTSDGISVDEEPAPEEPSDGGGMPVWVWAIIGLGGAAAVGGLGYWLIKGMPKQPPQR